MHMLQDKRTALMYAAVERHIDVVQLLLSRQDVKVNMRDKVNICVSNMPVTITTNQCM